MIMSKCASLASVQSPGLHMHTFFQHKTQTCSLSATLCAARTRKVSNGRWKVSRKKHGARHRRRCKKK
jgi:hypothetical protein